MSPDLPDYHRQFCAAVGIPPDATIHSVFQNDAGQLAVTYIHTLHTTMGVSEGTEDVNQEYDPVADIPEPTEDAAQPTVF